MRDRHRWPGIGARRPTGHSGDPDSSPVPNLAGVSGTALAALYWRAVESRRPDSLLEDKVAESLVQALEHAFESVAHIPMPELLNVMRAMLARQMDRYARDFLLRHPDGVVVHIGCGLDTRFQRVDNGRVEWFDLDLPEVISVRRKLLGEGNERHHLLAASVLSDAWLAAVEAQMHRPMLFLAETVLLYLLPEQVRSLVLKLRDRFPGAELVFDAWRPFEVWVGDRYFARSGSSFTGLLRWGVWGAGEVERWGEGIRLLDAWGFFDQPEPRLFPYRWMAPLFRIFKPIRVFHMQLGMRSSPSRDSGWGGRWPGRAFKRTGLARLLAAALALIPDREGVES